MERPKWWYGNLARRWWWLLVLGALIPAVVGHVLLARQPELYLAKATLMVGTGLQSPNPDPWQLNTANTLAAAYAQLAKEGPVLQAVINRLGANRDAKQLATQVTTRVYPDAQLLEIQVVDTDPRAAALIANALADELIRRSPVSQEAQLQRQAFVGQQLDDLEAQVKEIDEEIARLRASLIELTSAAELAETQERLRQLETAKGGMQATYASLLASYQQEVPNMVSLFDAAVEPQTPLPRRDVLFTAVAGAAGLALAVGGVLLIEYLDDAVRWEGDARTSLLGMAVLGAIPKLSSGSGTTLAVNPLSPAAEMVRTLRTNILLAVADQVGPHDSEEQDFVGRSTEGQPKVFLITSPTLHDGKTFAVAQLGAVVAAGGKRVVLVDADLRQPRLHEFFDLPNLHGLSELLRSQTPLTESDWSKGIQTTGVENLYLLSGGRPPLDPSFSLTSPRLPEVLSILKKQADLIFVDSPPVLAAPDAGILASIVDGVVLVVSAGSTSADKVAKAREHLATQDGVRLLGVAFNRVKVDSDSYYYGYGLEHRKKGHGFWGLVQRRFPFVRKWINGGDEQPVLGLADIADYLGVSREVARRWCKSGRLPCTRSWLGWRIKEEDLHRVAKQTWYENQTR